jgi:PKD repeat protein
VQRGDGLRWSAGVGTPDGIAGFTAASPTAAISAPAAVVVAAPASFSAAGSSALAGASLTGDSWTFGDGTTSAATVSHIDAAPGSYRVTLSVSDGGRTGTASAVVVVVAAGTTG